MELYTSVSYELSRTLTERFSTSFSQSSKLLGNEVRQHIYAIYGLVRIADEIVDTYKGKDKAKYLKELEVHTLHALRSGYSPNPIVHAFAVTAKQFGISRDLLRPFFKSMAMDLKPFPATKRNYTTYIYGSAEVIGLMCLKVFCNNPIEYKRLEKRARALGSAYQKVNFLRDIHSDYSERGRMYFPGVSYEDFSEAQKKAIIADIKKDFKKAEPAIAQLPGTSRSAVALSYSYYLELLNKLDRSSVEAIKTQRIRVSTPKKMQLLVKGKLKMGRI